jgi:hypothetical protein
MFCAEFLQRLHSFLARINIRISTSWEIVTRSRLITLSASSVNGHWLDDLKTREKLGFFALGQFAESPNSVTN